MRDALGTGGGGHVRPFGGVTEGAGAGAAAYELRVPRVAVGHTATLLRHVEAAARGEPCAWQGADAGACVCAGVALAPGDDLTDSRTHATVLVTPSALPPALRAAADAVAADVAEGGARTALHVVEVQRQRRAVLLLELVDAAGHAQRAHAQRAHARVRADADLEMAEMGGPVAVRSPPLLEGVGSPWRTPRACPLSVRCGSAWCGGARGAPPGYSSVA